jgi:hypothetical protein
MEMLTVFNYRTWCEFSVNGAPPVSFNREDICVPSGTVSLSTTPLTGFILGPAPWHHTDGDLTGSGDPGTVTDDTSSTTVTVTAPTGCVWVCCPFPSGKGCTPPVDPCSP